MEQQTEKEDIVKRPGILVIGSPGVGKRTILSSITSLSLIQYCLCYVSLINSMFQCSCTLIMHYQNAILKCLKDFQSFDQLMNNIGLMLRRSICQVFFWLIGFGKADIMWMVKLVNKILMLGY